MRCRFCVPVMMGVITLGVAMLAYWEFLDYRVQGAPISYYDQVVYPKQGRIGDKLMTRWRYQVHRDCPRDVSLYVAGVPRSFHHGSTRGRVMAAPRVFHRAVKVPDVPPGEYVIRSVAEFHCNPLRSYVASAEIPFTVLPSR